MLLQVFNYLVSRNDLLESEQTCWLLETGAPYSKRLELLAFGPGKGEVVAAIASPGSIWPHRHLVEMLVGRESLAAWCYPNAIEVKFVPETRQ